MTTQGARLTHRYHYRLMSRIYKILNSGDWNIRYARISGNRELALRFGVGMNVVGCVDEESESIILDPRKDVLATLLHECLHIIYPDKRESEVARLERFMLTHLSSVQARRLHQLSAFCLI